MKQGFKFFLLTLILVGVLIGAYFAYQNLGVKPAEITKATSADAQQAQESVQAADFKAIDRNGNDVHLSDFYGKPCVLNFWATWCGYCMQEMPEFESAFQAYGDRVNFLIVNLTDGERETVKTATAFIAENKYAFPVYFDAYGEAIAAYDAYSIPVSVFINADGTLYNKKIGAMSGSELNEMIEQLVNNQ